jgi:hypothetical protein
MIAKMIVLTHLTVINTNGPVLMAEYGKSSMKVITFSKAKEQK